MRPCSAVLWRALELVRQPVGVAGSDGQQKQRSDDSNADATVPDIKAQACDFSIQRRQSLFPGIMFRSRPLPASEALTEFSTQALAKIHGEYVERNQNTSRARQVTNL